VSKRRDAERRPRTRAKHAEPHPPLIGPDHAIKLIVLVSIPPTERADPLNQLVPERVQY
jgi:hypothetical protein